MFANNDDDSRLVLLLITHSHTYIHSHTHMFDSRSWVTDASFPHMDIVPAHTHTHKHTNADFLYHKAAARPSSVYASWTPCSS